MTFLIGRNPIQSEDRPYKYVPVRHVPSSPDSYEFYGEDLLTNFDALPTWVYSTPHNIQRNTPQTESCESCHENAALFLTADKVNESELQANDSVIVKAVPASVSLFAAAMPQPAGHAELLSNSCTACHVEGIRGAPLPPESHLGFVEESCTSCHELPNP
jgi:hypothetical protein